MNIKDIKGMKYPDDYFIRFFFKKGLQNLENKTFLELGCANGCNLSLPYQYNNKVIGVDYNSNYIGFAEDNFPLYNQETSYSFTCEDMRTFVCDKDYSVDVLVLANSIYYIPKEDFIKVLKQLKKNLNKEIPFFIRFRTFNDYRCDKGEVVGENAIIINNGITGEDGVHCQFYGIDEMVDLLKAELNLKEYEIMEASYENIQQGQVVRNEDVILWGTIN